MAWTTKEDTAEGYNSAAIAEMKPLLQKIEAETRETFPKEGAKGDVPGSEAQHSRSTILSALGTLGSANIRRIDNPKYAETIKEAIDLVVTGAHSPNAHQDGTQTFVREKVSSDPKILEGLAQLDLAATHSLQSAPRQR